MRIARSGRGRISIRRPRGLGESDRSGFWYNHRSLVRQFQWAGNSLIDTGLLVGPDEVDVPQQQFRALILPADPMPLVNPRPSPNITGVPIVGQPIPTSPMQLGFTVYILNASEAGLYIQAQGNNLAPYEVDEFGRPITDEFGNPISLGITPVPYYNQAQAGVLAAVAQLSGIPTPDDLYDASLTIAAAAVPQLLLPARARDWVLIYNPNVSQAQVGLASVTYWGVTTNLAIGPGQAYFWATAQGLGVPYGGDISVVSLTAGMTLWAWVSPSS